MHVHTYILQTVQHQCMKMHIPGKYTKAITYMYIAVINFVPRTDLAGIIWFLYRW